MLYLIYASRERVETIEALSQSPLTVDGYCLNFKFDKIVIEGNRCGVRRDKETQYVVEAKNISEAGKIAEFIEKFYCSIGDCAFDAALILDM